MQPSKAIIKLAIPATLVLLAKAVYNLVDTAYIGMLNSDIALTAVGVTVPLLIMVSIENIFAAGAAVLAGRQLGAKTTRLPGPVLHSVHPDPAPPVWYRRDLCFSACCRCSDLSGLCAFHSVHEAYRNQKYANHVVRKFMTMGMSVIPISQLRRIKGKLRYLIQPCSAMAQVLLSVRIR